MKTISSGELTRFAEALFAAAGGGWWSFVGPLLMTLLLLRVSGVPRAAELASALAPALAR